MTWGSEENNVLKKTMITVATITVVGLGSAFFTDSIHAETLHDLKTKQEKIQDQRANIKANLSKAEADIADILIDLENLNDEISRTDKALKENEKAMKKTTDDIAATEAEVAELEEAIAKRYEILKQRAVSYQKSGGNIGYLDVIFGSNSFGEFISRVSAVTKITESDQELMTQIEKDKENVEKKLSNLEDMKVELEGMKTLILEQKEQNEAKKQELKQKKKDLQAKKDKLQLKDSNLASLEAQVRNSISSATAPQVSSSQSGGGKLTTLGSKSLAPSKSFNSAISAGYSVLGTPYVWAGKRPGGFDCSGFVSWAYSKAGVSIPSSTSALSGVGSKVTSGPQPGDLVFFNTYKTNGHVGIYIGGGKFIGAQNSTGVAVADMTSGYWKSKFNGHVRRVR